MTITDIAKAWTQENVERWKDEEFHDDLLPYVHEIEVFGTSVKHPLIFDIAAHLPGLTNLRYLAKKEALEAALDKGAMEAVVWLHERPYRFEAMVEFALERDDFFGEAMPVWQQPKDIQSLVGQVWRDSENIDQYRDGWLEVFRDRPAGMVLTDTEQDDAGFRKLPERVTLHRGGGEDSFLSWSTNPATAVFFADRFAKRDRSLAKAVHTIEVDKADIFAYYTSRGEFEALTFAGIK